MYYIDEKQIQAISWVQNGWLRSGDNPNTTDTFVQELLTNRQLGDVSIGYAKGARAPR